MIERIAAENAPEPKGPYSHAVKAAGFIYVSGQVALDPVTGTPQRGTTGEETRHTLENIKSILTAAGATLADIIKCNVYLEDIRDFLEMNEMYGEYFGQEKPARTTVQARLPMSGMKVEIDCIAYVPDEKS